ncbi:MAG: hypothetical protein JSV35_06085 [Candidatus Bathyarchaeota archaeon]|nr:MAG: hypothetical protein JSV35_06085 [Candidatus Bathyarchaeota archaeon]
MSDKNEILRHFLAAIAYRGTKAIKNAPRPYSDVHVGKGVRTPRELLHHITGVLTYAHSFFAHYETTHFQLKSWDAEVEAFYDVLSKLDKSLQQSSPREVTEEQLLQGPFSDAMAHIGQLSLLRRMADSPIPSENFICAAIQKGAVGPDQPDPVAPDE